MPPRRWLPAFLAIVLLAPVAAAQSRRRVHLPPDPSGIRPRLSLFVDRAAAQACARAMANPGASGVTACTAPVRLRHDTTVELLPPPGACGDGYRKVRVLDGPYRGRIGCARGAALWNR